jgi:large subunit ribosomal protein L35
VPKMKSHRGLAKRVRRTASGRLKRRRAYHSHLLSSKSKKRKRRLRGGTEVDAADFKRLDALLNL